MIYGQILAGGLGTRMGNTELPKQYLTIGEKPIIVHTLEQFLLNPKFDRIIVSAPDIWMDYNKDLIEKHLPSLKGIDFVEGGATRNETIMNACTHIETRYGLGEEDIIVTHDAVRPFINQRILNDNIEASAKFSAVDTAIPAADTIIESKDGLTISNIPIRDMMYQGQTPQTFNIKKLKRLYDKLSDEQKIILSDACKIFHIFNEEVHIVQGDVSNFKITTLYDLKLANAILTHEVKK